MSKIKMVRENGGDGGGAVYALGLIGALIYFWQGASTFSEVLFGLFKALVWPAYFVYHIFGLLRV